MIKYLSIYLALSIGCAAQQTQADILRAQLLKQRAADPFADNAAGLLPNIGNSGNISSGKKTTEQKQVEQLSIKDKARYQAFKKFSVYRNVSSIMETQSRLAQPNPDTKLAAPQEPDYSKLPTDPAQAAPQKKKIDDNYQKLLLNYQIGQELEQLKNNITLGNWDKVKNYFAQLPPVTSKLAFTKISYTLSSNQSVNPIDYLKKNGTAKSQQKPLMLTSDILAWLEVPVEAPTTADIRKLSELITSEGELPSSFYQTLNKGSRYIGGPDLDKKIRAAELLIYANRPNNAANYLPSTKQALKLKNYKALNLLAIYHQKLHEQKPFDEHLQTAWNINRAILNLDNTPLEITEQSMTRSFEILPQLKDKTKGSNWFKDTFKAKRERGMTLLSFVGIVTAQSQGNKDENFRLEKIRLQHATANALINSAQDQLNQWSSILTLYAKNWIHEAEFSFIKDKSTSIGPSPTTDTFGNVYFARQNPSYTSNRNENRPIKAGDILTTGPNKAWLSTLDEQTRLVCLKNYARLYLKMKEDEIAFSYIQSISKINPTEAKRFISELITVWADNHDPNVKQSRRNSWYYSYGYNQRAESIPLTRSKQQRNLEQLKLLVERLKTIGISKDDEVALARAFIRCHSKAEIWRMDVFEGIFGETNTLSPETITAVVQTMRANLVRVWPAPKLQKDMKTRRTDVELQQEVVSGYNSAIALCNSILKLHPDEWNLSLQRAALLYGMNEYLTLIEKNSNTAAKKSQALDAYALAAKAYNQQLAKGSIRPDLTVYENWFYAALGSADLATLKSKHLLNKKEIAKIKESLLAITPRFKQDHMDKFANLMATRISGVGPDLKLRYLKAGLEIVGDNKRADEARKLEKYYKDLISEIQIVTQVDGSTDINHTEPFGLIVNLRHTKEIEREAGGFSKYLQNQSNNGGYNYGRPTENYRDKFSEKVMAAMDEHFEVKSITFHKDNVESYTDKEHGWRITPYAYIVIQPKGPQVDSIPSLQIDFDFLDTSNYVVIPIESAKLPISCTTDKGSRPAHDLKVIQIFDDRSAEKEGEYLLEVKAEGHGIIPPIQNLLDLSDLDGFDITNIDDKGSQVETLDSSSLTSPAKSKRHAIVHLKPSLQNGNTTDNFTFPTASLPLKKDQGNEKGMALKRYLDVDLVAVDQTIEIEPTKSWTWWQITLYILAGLIILLAIIFFIRKRSKPLKIAEELTPTIPMPSSLTPVTALSVLERVRSEKQLSAEQSKGLLADTENIMQNYFGKGDASDDSKLISTVQKWIQV